ncbi:MAG: Rha family transcriptional regulator [Azoarcus sp.]|jgi:Rha family phage regulatory protein|nr:Rha family transcriptional regulator [Azoarcus sp.]
MFDLFPETLLVETEGSRVYTTSLKVAEHFGKRHKNVLQSIQKLLGDLPESGGHRLNFQPMSGADDRNRERIYYRLTKAGFYFVTMGFTGAQAAEWKWKFIDAFETMEREIAVLKEREAAALYAIRPRWKPIAEHPAMRRAALIELTGHKSPASITACRRRMREVGLL